MTTRTNSAALRLTFLHANDRKCSRKTALDCEDKAITTKDELTREKEGISTLVDGRKTADVVFVECAPGEPTSVAFNVSSADYDIYLLSAFLLENTQLVKVKFKEEVVPPVKIPKGGYCTLILTVHTDDITTQILSLAMKFARDGRRSIILIRFLRVRCTNDTVRRLEDEAITEEVKPINAPQLERAAKIVKIKRSKTMAGCVENFCGTDGVLIRLKQRSTASTDPDDEDDSKQPSDRLLPLNMYYPDARLVELHLAKMVITDSSDTDLKEFYDIISTHLSTGITGENPENYDKYMQILLHCEDIQQETDIRLYDKSNARLRPFTDDRERFELKVEGLSEGRPSLLPWDALFVRFCDDPNVEYEGFIHRVLQMSVEIIMSEQFQNKYFSLAYDSDDDTSISPTKAENLEFGIRFTVNRKVIRLMHRALGQVNQRREKRDPIEAVLIPQTTWPANPALRDFNGQLEFVNKSISRNPEQLNAVLNIVLGLSRPLPYIVFGPPGTGKTTTISEAIIQVYKLIPESRILICAPSNSAVNVVTEKVFLSGAVPKCDIFRFYGMSCKRQKVPDIFEEISNYDPSEDRCDDVDKKTIMEYRIIACTLSMTGSLVTLGFTPGHFTHIFIDEAGHAMELEALIPIAGLHKMYNAGQCDPSGSLILSGDPLQLGPIIRSPVARMYAFGRSLLERLMDTKPYRRQKNNAFNPMVLTKLVRNFRSHHLLLELPNRLFYDDELMACGNRKFTHAMVNYELLPETGVPMIFHGIKGVERQEKQNPSFYNPEEIAVIEDYVVNLMKSKDFEGNPIREQDIGIISPYRRQVLKIRQVLENRGYKNITVGSTEEFQGQERLIMLVSTVRSNANKAFDDVKGQTLGFLKNQKRFNVAITRAKALLIVVGDPTVLRKDFCWRNLMNTCREKNAYRGEGFEQNMAAYKDLINKLDALEIELGLEGLKGRVLATNGQVAITDLTLQEEPQWRDEE
ncbi:putative helicase MOV-10-like [Tropilaelaps mercedesae]|uniref:RNA helicase n=1 Tax=Tropilaelaps mercedesae TaxID=418985 RepID=A0A1V9XNF0_9ACAR|nr:putative helicase MOV-10-like [Tropilaelaps mercedesae]